MCSTSPNLGLMYQVEVQLPLQTLWKPMVKLSLRWSACSGIGLNVEAQDIWLGGLDMDQNMTNGSMKTIWAMPRPCWTNTSVHMGYSECFASGMYCTRPLYVSRILGSIEPATINLAEALRQHWESSHEQVVACCGHVNDWSPTGGSSLVRGSVRAHALHCLLATEQWHCTVATLLPAVGHPQGVCICPGGHHWLGGTSTYQELCRFSVIAYSKD